MADLCDWPDCEAEATGHVQHSTLGWIAVCRRHQTATYLGYCPAPHE